MWKILLILLLAGGSTVFAQDCGGCDKDADKGADKGACTLEAAPVSALTDAVTKLEAGAKKGCAKSSIKLAKLEQAFNVKDVTTLKARLSAYEGYAGQGCDSSAKELARAKTVLDSDVLLSERAVFYATCGEKGCKTSKAKLDLIVKECGLKDGKLIVAHLVKLETEAKSGSKESALILASIETKLAPPRRAPALSVRVAKLAETDKAAVAALLEECGTGRCESLVGKIEKLEASAAQGCKTSAAKLATLEAKLAVPAKIAAPAKPAPKAEQAPAGCEDCGTCPSGCKPAGPAG